GDGSPKVGIVMGLYFYSFAGAAAAAVTLTPMVMRLSRVLGIVDRPNERKVHFRPTPRAGGVGIFAATALALIPALFVLGAGAGAAATIALVAAVAHQPAVAVIALTLLGSLCGFLVFNFNPAKVFMGDCGSMFLGFLLATASLVCAKRTGMSAGFTLPALALGI